MEITAKITGIKYTPLMCRELHTFDINQLETGLSKEGTFLLQINSDHKVAVSWWVSSKRTRSYPYARVYDSLHFSGRKLSIVPIMKDEGIGGDRDFLQWDTVSLMSLLGVYVIISYYVDASKSSEYENKITDQRYDVLHIKQEISKLLSYQSDALHWNLDQLERVGDIANSSLSTYAKISEKLGIEMHSVTSARKRIHKLQEGKDAFLSMSRDLAKRAQARESVTHQPLEKLEGTKAKMTIQNYLGGMYFFTCDEAELQNHDILLVEGKHSSERGLPKLGDIKDGLLKMILLTNLEDVTVENIKYTPKPVLKLTTEGEYDSKSANKEERVLLDILRRESITNGFRVLVNTQYLEQII